jgi:exoribonuclease R
VLACLPATPWAIPAAERALRRPLQAERIFSIDPPTARDLDDALSIKRLPGGGFELGVHIADVAHFIPPQCALDQEARCVPRLLGGRGGEQGVAQHTSP